MKQFDELQFLAEDDNKSICEKISNRVLEISLEEITEELGKQFVFQQDAIKCLYTATATNQNAILFGPGGFSKSRLIVEFYKLLGIPLHFKVGHEECTTEELLGMPNIQKMLNESKLETAFENSIFSKPGILCLEEGLDIPPTVAACLKDILSQKGLREGDTFKESRISNVIIIGNKSVEEIAVSDTLKAFYTERFPLRSYMIWKDFSAGSYFKFFEVFFKERIKDHYDEFLLLAELCSANKNGIISPRIAASAGEVILKLGLSHLGTITDLDSSEIDKYKYRAKLKSRLEHEKSLISILKDRVSVIQSNVCAERSLFEYHLFKDLVNNTNFTSDNIIISADLVNSVDEKIHETVKVVSYKYDGISKFYEDLCTKLG